MSGNLIQIPGLAIGASMADVATALKKSFGTPMADPLLPEALQKATFNQSGSATSGLTYYDLEAGAKFLYPVLTPLRNEIPRVSGKGGIQANWRAVTAINTTGIRVGVSQGNRNAVMAVQTKDYTAAYKGIGMEDSVTFEAQYAGQGFDDVRAIAAKTGLEALMLGEEAVILGGNGSLALGVTPTPVLAQFTTGGSLSDGTYSVIAVALTLDGVMNGSIAGGIQASITRQNADGSSDTFGGGSAQKSANQTIVVNGGGAVQRITARVTAVRGAVGYAWFWGAAGSETLGAITGTPTNTITTAAGAGSQLASSLPASDNSINNLVFDGLYTQAFKSDSNAYWTDLGGTTLTSDGAGGIVEFDTALKSLWDNYRLSPDTIWLNSQQALDIGKKIMNAGQTTGAYRVVFNPEQGMVAGGIMVATYLNRFSMAGAQTLKVRIHPNAPNGVVLMTTSKLPYPLSNVGNVMQIRTRQDYYQIEWPLVTRKYEYGVYADEVLQHYFPPSMALITGIAPG